MRFFREHSKLISRLFVNQIGMTVFGLVLTLAVMRAADNNTALTVGVSVFSILFYLFLIYNVMWEKGARDVVRIESGKEEKKPFFALKVSAAASIPNFVLALLLFLFYLLGTAAGLPIGQTLYTVMHIILGLFEAMYVGLFGAILGLVETDGTRYLLACILYLLSSLPMILVSVGAYALGMHNIYLFGKKPKEDAK